ncbi:MAG TPA: hypothetical protein VGM51_18855 [Armatimonadota bacterium]|jgi:hypothetical protein
MRSAIKFGSVAVSVLLAAAGAFSAEPELKPATLPPFVYTPGSASYVAGPHVLAAQFSQSGRHVLLTMTTPEGARRQAEAAAAHSNINVPPPGFAPLSVVMWSRRTHRSAVSWTSPWEEATLRQICWLPGSDTALVAVWALEQVRTGNDPPHKRLVFHLLQLDPRLGTAVERRTILGGPSTHIELSPRLPIALLCDGGESTESIRIIRQDTIGAPIPIPADASDFNPKWSADGATFYMRVFGPGSDFQKGKSTSWLAIDTGRETATPVDSLPADSVDRVENAPPVTPFNFIESVVSVKDGGRVFEAHPLWLDCGGRDVFLLHPDAGKPDTPRQSDAVVYVADGIAFLRDLQRAPRPSLPPAPSGGRQ